MTLELRNEPIQARSKATLDKLLAAARKAYVLHGRDRITTAHVAEYSGVSIGTVYRYFPDRVMILDAIVPNREPGFTLELSEEEKAIADHFEAMPSAVSRGRRDEDGDLQGTVPA